MFKIMIVEDGEKISGIIKENIDRWGYEGTIIKDFNSVFDYFVKYKPDLVLLDISLPFYDGFYWCNRIRNDFYLYSWGSSRYKVYC